MKPILYAGAIVMIGASIYGFADYKKTVRNKAFRNMYQENEKKGPVVEKKNELTATFTEPNEISLDENMSEEKVVTDKTAIENTSAKDEKNSERKKGKKLDAELFSRAPLKEYTEVKEVPESLQKIEKEKAVQ
jgi:hypothetical protein